MEKKSDLKNAFDNKYLNIKILFGYIEMKPKVYSLDVCKLFKDWSLIYMKKNKKLFWVPILPYFTIEMNLNRIFNFLILTSWSFKGDWPRLVLINVILTYSNKNNGQF